LGAGGPAAALAGGTGPVQWAARVPVPGQGPEGRTAGPGPGTSRRQRNEGASQTGRRGPGRLPGGGSARRRPRPGRGLPVRRRTGAPRLGAAAVSPQAAPAQRPSQRRAAGGPKGVRRFGQKPGAEMRRSNGIKHAPLVQTFIF